MKKRCKVSINGVFQCETSYPIENAITFSDGKDNSFTWRRKPGKDVYEVCIAEKDSKRVVSVCASCLHAMDIITGDGTYFKLEVLEAK